MISFDVLGPKCPVSKHVEKLACGSHAVCQTQGLATSTVCVVPSSSMQRMRRSVHMLTRTHTLKALAKVNSDDADPPVHKLRAC